MNELIVCTIKQLPDNQITPSARRAAEINPLNHVTSIKRFNKSKHSTNPGNMRISVLTTKYWGVEGVHLTVGFLDNPPRNLRRRILSHLNAWNKTAKIKFSETQTDPEVRIARQPGEGH